MTEGQKFSALDRRKPSNCSVVQLGGIARRMWSYTIEELSSASPAELFCCGRRGLAAPGWTAHISDGFASFNANCPAAVLSATTPFKVGQFDGCVKVRGPNFMMMMMMRMQRGCRGNEDQDPTRMKMQ